MKFEKIILSVLMFIYATIGNAAEKSQIKVDVYRSKQVSIETIHQNKLLMTKLYEMADIMQSPKSLASEKNVKKAEKLFKDVSIEISKLGDFTMTNLSPIMYPDNKTIYYTIDLVDKTDNARLEKFMKAPQETITGQDQLIEAWQKYEKAAANILFNSKTIKVKFCPVFHCTYGFDYPELKKYLAIFNTAEKNKIKLIEILKHDKNPEKRSAAAFLLGHIKNGKELISVLTPSMRDPDFGVRNSVMRVLAQALYRLKNPDFPIEKAVETMDYPRLTDRNKGLYIIQNLVQQKRYADYVLLHAKKQLMDELKMSQKNVHDQAYDILKRITGKNFGERDYKAWENWLNHPAGVSSRKMRH